MGSTSMVYGQLQFKTHLPIFQGSHCWLKTWGVWTQHMYCIHILFTHVDMYNINTYIYIYLSLKCSQSETGSCMQFYKKVLKTVWFRPQVGPQIGDPTSAACGPRTLRALSVPWPGCGEAGGLKRIFLANGSTFWRGETFLQGQLCCSGWMAHGVGTRKLALAEKLTALRPHL